MRNFRPCFCYSTDTAAIPLDAITKGPVKHVFKLAPSQDAGPLDDLLRLINDSAHDIAETATAIATKPGCSTPWGGASAGAACRRTSSGLRDTETLCLTRVLFP